MLNATIDKYAYATIQPRTDGLVRFVALGVLITAGLLTYAVAAQLFGAYDLRDVGRLMARRRLRGAKGSAISPAP